METIVINGEDENVISYLNKNTITSYRFLSDNKVENIGEEIYSYFYFLKDPSNFLKLSSEDGYEVILDLETNFKHYYMNGLQDFAMFFINNGEEAVLYSVIDSTLEKLKKLRFGKRIFKLPDGKTITTSFLSLLLVASLGLGITNVNAMQPSSESKVSQLVDATVGTLQFYGSVGSNILEVLINNPVEKDEYMLKYFGKNITPEDIKQWYVDAKLSEDVIDCLYDGQFLNDVLPLINSSEYAKQVFFLQNHGIKISTYERAGLNSGTAGYVGTYSSTIHLANDYSDIESDFYAKDTLIHEGTIGHLSQVSRSYRPFAEACAELYKYEYKGYPLSAYKKIIKSIKKLIEVIGSEPIRYYLHTGNDELLKESIKPFLTKTQYAEFLACLYTPLSDSPEIASKMDEITEILYRQIYGKNPKDNTIFALINKGKDNGRYYFNSQKRNIPSVYYNKNVLRKNNVCINVKWKGTYEELSKLFDNYEDFILFFERYGDLEEFIVTIQLIKDGAPVSECVMGGGNLLSRAQTWVEEELKSKFQATGDEISPPPLCIPGYEEKLKLPDNTFIIILPFESSTGSRKK